MLSKKIRLGKLLSLCLCCFIICGFGTIFVNAETSKVYTPDWFSSQNDKNWWDGNSYGNCIDRDGFEIHHNRDTWEYMHRWSVEGGSARLDCNTGGESFDALMYRRFNYDIDLTKPIDVYIQVYKIINGTVDWNTRSFIKLAELKSGNNTGEIDLTENPEFMSSVNADGKIYMVGISFYTYEFTYGDTINVKTVSFVHSNAITPAWFNIDCDNNWYSSHCYSGLTGTDGGFYINHGASWQYFHRWSAEGGTNANSANVTVNNLEYTLDINANNSLNYNIKVSKAVSIYLDVYNPQTASKKSVFLLTLKPGENIGNISLLDYNEIASAMTDSGLLKISGMSFYTWSFAYGDTIDVNSFKFDYSDTKNKVFSIGDINSDGLRDDKDINTMKISLLDNSDISEINDYNGDSEINVCDTFLLNTALKGMSKPASEKNEVIPDESNYQTYYIDSKSGNDSNDGKSESKPWKSLSQINNTVFEPGTKILIKCGSVFNGTLAPKSSGTEDKLIVIDSYGKGAKPVINGGGNVYYTLLIKNVQYIEVRNLEITNKSDVNTTRMGVYVNAGGSGNIGGYYKHIYLKNLDVHDVTSREGDRWSGGIVFVSNVADNPTAFSDILVENCTVKNTEGNGITFTSDYNNRQGVTWGSADYFPSENVIFRGNYVSGAAGDGIYFNCINGGIMEYNVVTGCCYANGAYAGMWPHNSTNVIMQYNEAYDNKLVGGDGQGFDVDINCNNTFVQYNYSHDNEGGFLLLCTTGDEGGYNTNITVRYNITQNDKSQIFTLSGPIENVSIYNNTVFYKEGLNTNLVGSYDWGTNQNPKSVSFVNNIFYCNGSGKNIFRDAGEVSFDNNLLYGSYNFSNLPAKNSKIADPCFENPGSGSYGIATVKGYSLKDTSPCIDSGIIIAKNGMEDYDGNWLLTDGKPDLGALEHIS